MNQVWVEQMINENSKEEKNWNIKNNPKYTLKEV
jgi:hypothetical protein